MFTPALARLRHALTKPRTNRNRRTPIRQTARAAAEAVRPLLESLEPRALLSTSVLSYHNGNTSTGVNATETLLTPSSVTVATFGKQFSTPVDGQLYAQPLYAPGINITSGNQQGVHDVAYVATEHDSLYAIDSNGGNVLWKVSLSDVNNPSVNLLGASTIITMPSGETGSADLTPEIGITSTPVIDLATNSIYLCAKSKQTITGSAGPHYVHTLFRVDIRSGQITGSTIIGDTMYSGGTYTYRTGADPYVVGAGAGAITVGGQSRVYFNAMRQMNRPGLVLANGALYISSASHGDNGPYHGWVLRYNPSTLALTGALNTTPNGGLGGIWQAGGITVVDPQGYLYFETGNGSFNTNAANFDTIGGVQYQGLPHDGDYGDCFVKIADDPTTSATNQNKNGWGMKVVDYFSPFNNAQLDSADTDLGSGGPVILPDSVGNATHPHLLVGSGKEGKVYLIDRDKMGGFDPATDHVVQSMGSAINGSLNTPAFLPSPGGTSGTLYYFPGYSGVGKAFTISNAAISAPIAQTPDTIGYLDGTPSISINGNTNGIVWVIDRGSNQLKAYRADNLGTQLWTSASAPNNRDQLGAVVKFTVPTVADGKVFAGTASALVVYGPPVPPTSPPATPSGLSASAANFQTVNLSWVDNSNNEDIFKIERSTDNVIFTQIATAGANSTTYTDTSTLATTTYYYRVRAFNSFNGGSNSPGYSNVAQVTTPQAPPTGSGDGAAGAYFNDGGGHLVGSPALVRNDPVIDFNWDVGAPGGGVGADHFSVRWTGNIVAPKSETFQFDTYTDDGVRLYVNGQLIIDNWTDHGPTHNFGSMALVSGQKYSMVMEFYENGGGALAQLHWTSPTTADQAVPISGGATGSYYNDPTGTTTHLQPPAALNRVDQTIDFDWGGGSPATGVIPDDKFSVRWTGKVQAQYSETYTFHTVSDDGIRLWVNGVQLINDWTDHGMTDDFGTIALSAGQKYDFILEFYENGGGAIAKLWWSSPSTPDQPIQRTQLYSGTAPVAPSGLTAVAASGTQINLAWADNSNIETGFVVERKDGAAGTFAAVATLPPSTTSYMDGALNPNVLYTYRVKATNFAADSAYSNTVSLTTPIPPARPSNAHPTSVTTTQIAMAWNDNADNEEGYRISRIANGGTSIVIATLPPNTTTCTDNGVTAGNEYEYHVQAFNVAGFNDFTGFNTATLTLAPTGLTAQADGGGVAGVTLNWTAPAYGGDVADLSFNVYRGTTPGGELATPIATGLLSPTYHDAAVVSGTTYYYKVTAVDPGGESARSGEAFATPVAGQAPAAPTGLSASAAPGAKVSLSWNTSGGASTYSLYRSNSSGTETLLISGLTGTSYLDSQVTAGTTYFYQVTASNTFGESTRSTEASATPVAPPSSAPTVNATGGAGTVSLSWSAVATATGYNIYRSTTSGAETLLVGNVAGPGYIDGSLSAGTRYYYKVSAINAGGEGPLSTEASAITRPAAPTGLTATGVAGPKISVSWSASTGATSYNLYRSTSSGAETLLISGLAGTSYQDSQVTGGTTYFYQVTASNTGGESARSTEASAAAPVAPPASAPTVNATGGDSSISLSWSAVATATGYNIYRSTTSGTETLLASNVAGTNYLNSGLSAGTQYFYKVSAINAGGEGPLSTEVSAVTRPSAPTGLAAVGASAQISLSWNASQGATSYSVYRSTNSGAETLLVSGLATPSYTDTQVAGGTTYFYQVTASNAAGESARGNEASAAPVVPPATAPTVTATGGSGKVTLAWSAVATATAYNVYRSTTSGAETLLAFNVTGTGYVDTNVLAGGRYYYKVSAVNAGGEGPLSAEVSAIPTVPIPPAPANVTAIGQQKNIKVSWDAVPGATAYRIYRSLSSGAEVLYVTLNGTNYVDKLVQSPFTYYYQVTAYNAAGESLRSIEVAATPLR